MTATATTKTAFIDRQRYSKYKDCKCPIYVKPVVLSDNMVKLLAYNFFNNTRHLCYVDPAEVLKQQIIEAAEVKA